LYFVRVTRSCRCLCAFFVRRFSGVEPTGRTQWNLSHFVQCQIGPELPQWLDESKCNLAEELQAVQDATNPLYKSDLLFYAMLPFNATSAVCWPITRCAWTRCKILVNPGQKTLQVTNTAEFVQIISNCDNALCGSRLRFGSTAAHLAHGASPVLQALGIFGAAGGRSYSARKFALCAANRCQRLCWRNMELIDGGRGSFRTRSSSIGMTKRHYWCCITSLVWLHAPGQSASPYDRILSFFMYSIPLSRLPTLLARLSPSLVLDSFL
jgi:hypothetical protein